MKRGALALFLWGKGAGTHRSRWLGSKQTASARRAQLNIWGIWGPGTWADTIMRRPALQVAHAILINAPQAQMNKGPASRWPLSVMVHTAMG